MKLENKTKKRVEVEASGQHIVFLLLIGGKDYNVLFFSFIGNY